jgi:hypothetical protein
MREFLWHYFARAWRVKTPKLDGLRRTGLMTKRLILVDAGCGLCFIVWAVWYALNQQWGTVASAMVMGGACLFVAYTTWVYAKCHTQPAPGQFDIAKDCWQAQQIAVLVGSGVSFLALLFGDPLRGIPVITACLVWYYHRKSKRLDSKGTAA